MKVVVVTEKQSKNKTNILGKVLKMEGCNVWAGDIPERILGQIKQKLNELNLIDETIKVIVFKDNESFGLTIIEIGVKMVKEPSKEKKDLIKKIKNRNDH